MFQLCIAWLFHPPFPSTATRHATRSHLRSSLRSIPLLNTPLRPGTCATSSFLAMARPSALPKALVCDERFEEHVEMESTNDAPNHGEDHVRDETSVMDAYSAEDRENSTGTKPIPRRLMVLRKAFRSRGIRAISRRGRWAAVKLLSWLCGILDGLCSIRPRFAAWPSSARKARETGPLSFLGKSDRYLDPVEISMGDRYLGWILEMAGNLAGILRCTILRETPWRRRRRSPRPTSEGSWSCETGTRREKRCWCRCEGEEAERKDGCKAKDKPNRNQCDSRKANLHGYMLKAKANEVRTTKGGRHRRKRSRE